LIIQIDQGFERRSTPEVIKMKGLFKPLRYFNKRQKLKKRRLTSILANPLIKKYFMKKL